MGGGDAKLMGAIGALGGWQFALASLFYGLIVAGLMALIVMLRHRVLRRTLGRVWRFLVLVTMRAKPCDPSGSDSPTIAVGVALAIGAAIGAVDVLFGGPVTKMLFGVG